MKQYSSILLAAVMALLMAGCRNTVEIEQDGWAVTADPVSGTLMISAERAGIIAEEVSLNLERENELVRLTGWTVDREPGKMTISTGAPEETSWEFRLSGTALDVSCSAGGGVITGTALADEDRIPARVAEQDNGIMYTQMGPVSATNIHHLFDMPTDILIGYSEASRLTRNANDPYLMDIRIKVTGDIEFSVMTDYYTNVIGLADHQVTDFRPVYKPIPGHFKTAATGWSSWYCYYMAPEEDDLVAETDALAEKLGPYGLEYVQLDAAFTRGEEANWLDWNREMYPRGGRWWFDYIRSRGLKPGLWVNIYGDNYEKPSMADGYPENFYLRDSLGNLSGACCTADKTVVRLDYTNPEVLEKHLRPLFETLVNEWGLTYLKDAGWGRWMDYYEENRGNAFNPEMDSREAYLNAQEVVRDVMGENYIVGCSMHEIGMGFGLYDGHRTGADDYASWTGEGHKLEGMQTFFNSLFAGNYLNGICWWSDPDDVMIRDPLTMDEARTIVSTASLSGQAYIISDFIAGFSRERLGNFLDKPRNINIGWARQFPDLVKGLSQEKLDLYRRTMPAMPIRAMDLYPFRSEAVCCAIPDTFPDAMDLKVSAATGMYDVVAVYNWKDEAGERTINLQEDLGLEHGDYLVFDYWDRKLAGIAGTTISQEIPAHGCKALIIKKAVDEPTVLATSRHLTGALSIRGVEWDPETMILSGVSETVPGDPYKLYIYVPEGISLEIVEIAAETVTHNIGEDRILEVNFTGRQDPVQWDVFFYQSPV